MISQDVEHEENEDVRRFSSVKPVTELQQEEPTTTLTVDIGEKLGILDGVKVEFISRKHSSDSKDSKNVAKSFSLDIKLIGSENKNVHTNFIAIPHHPITVTDGQFINNVIGFLEIIDLDKADVSELKFVPDEKNESSTYSIEIPIENLDAGYGTILIYSPQSEPHRNHIKSHLKEGRIKDPRI